MMIDIRVSAAACGCIAGGEESGIEVGVLLLQSYLRRAIAERHACKGC